MGQGMFRLDAIRQIGASSRSRPMDLSRFSAVPSARLSGLSFESDRAFPAQCRVPPSWIVEPIDVFEDRPLSLLPRFP